MGRLDLPPQEGLRGSGLSVEIGHKGFCWSLVH